jgi:hypothetical protein
MPHERHTNRELKTYLTFNSHSTKQVSVEVVESKTLEVTLAHFWSSASGTEHTCDIDLEVSPRNLGDSWFVPPMTLVSTWEGCRFSEIVWPLFTAISIQSMFVRCELTVHFGIQSDFRLPALSWMAIEGSEAFACNFLTIR